MSSDTARQSASRDGAEPAGSRSWLRSLGAGFVTGASDDDPSGIATYSQVGAQFGLAMAWTPVVTLPLMATVQEICDRTALVTGQNLGELSRRKFARRGRLIVVVMLVALTVANTLNIAADVVAVGSGVQLLGAGPQWVWSLIAGTVVLVLVVLGSFGVVEHVFKILCLGLLAYIGVLFVSDVDWAAVLKAIVVPQFSWSRDYIALLAAVLGTTISPYLFFWQSQERRDELADPHNPTRPLTQLSKRAADAEQRRSRFDVVAGMAFSNLVMFAIIVSTASTLNRAGTTDITSASQAAQALQPIAGDLSTVLFALGFIGSGMLAIPVLAGSGAGGIAGLASKDSGFAQSFRHARLFYVLVAAGTIAGTVTAIVGLDPFTLLIVAAIVNGVVAAPFLVVVMLIARDRSIMGERRNRRWATGVGWATVGLMTAAAIAVLVTTFI